MSKHALDYGQKARGFDTTDFQDASVKRIIKELSDIESAALPPTQLEEVRDRMTSGMFSTICVA